MKTHKQQFEKLVRDIDLQNAEGKNVNGNTLKINVTNSLGRMHDYDQDQRRLLKQSYQGAHMLARREFFGQADEKLESWAKAIPQFEPYFSASQICSSWEKIGDYLILEEEKIWHLGEVDRKTKDYRASLSDITKSEWILEKCQETEKLVKQLMQTYQKQAYVLVEEAKQEHELDATKNLDRLQKEIEDIRNTVLQKQKDSGTVSRSPKSGNIGYPEDQSRPRR